MTANLVGQWGAWWHFYPLTGMRARVCGGNRHMCPELPQVPHEGHVSFAGHLGAPLSGLPRVCLNLSEVRP
jgi:hypothetical protein